MSTLVRRESFRVWEEGDYVESPVRRAQVASISGPDPTCNLMIMGDHASSFLRLLIQDKLSFLPKVRSRPLDLLREGQMVCVQAPGGQGSPEGAHVFQVGKVKKYRTFEHLFENIPWETLVPWEKSQAGAMRVCRSLPNGDQEETLGVTAISLEYSHPARTR